METHDTIIELEDITFAHESRREVLKGLTFAMSEGERVGLTGHNGSGKTTLFHVIMGLLVPLDGRIRIFGKDRKKEPDFRQVRERIGLLFQDSDDQLFSPTVAEDISFGPLNLGKSRRQAADIVRDTLDTLGMAGFEERITYNLSGGEKKLIAFATVLAMRPEVLLLDEPTAGLDGDLTKRLADILKNQFHSYMIISHDKQLLRETTNSIYTMTNGTIRKG
jgi:cobalt/nickel transport system ATP-binding protein